MALMCWAMGYEVDGHYSEEERSVDAWRSREDTYQAPLCSLLERSTRDDDISIFLGLLP